MTAKPRWGRSDYGHVYHLVGGSYWDTTYARCGPVLTRFVPDYTPTEDERCLRCRKMAEKRAPR